MYTVARGIIGKIQAHMFEPDQESGAEEEDRIMQVDVSGR